MALMRANLLFLLLLGLLNSTGFVLAARIKEPNPGKVLVGALEKFVIDFPQKPDNEDKACAAEQGFCVLSDGSDQNSGVIKLNSVDGNTLQAQNDCLEKCANNPDATGCEFIWDQENGGCYVHTQSIARGNDADRHLCWVFSKCNGI